MAVVDWQKRIPALSYTGKLDEPNGLGLMILGWSHLGHLNDKAGYYQIRHMKKGRGIVKCRHYWNPPHTTEKALAWKAVFAQAVSAWQALDPEQKEVYNNMRYQKGQTGYSRFLTQYLKLHA